MAQKIGNIYRLVRVPQIYTAIQWALGDGPARQRFVRDLVKPDYAASVLDVGCGPASMLAYLPDVQYTGIDLNPAHIEHASRLYPGRGRFLVGDVSDGVPDGPFDVAIAIALLHHLDDQQASTLIAGLAGVLKSGGRIVTLDPVWLPRENPIAKLVKSLDSGRNIRSQEGYQALADGLPLKVETRLYRDLLNIPYDNFGMVLTL